VRHESVGMGYYMRYFSTQEDLDLDTLEAALKQVDPRYCITDRFEEDRGEGATGVTGELRVGDEVFAVITVDRPPLADEIDEMLDEIADYQSVAADRVREVLRTCRASVAVQVLGQERETEATLQRIDSIWEWLFPNRPGLMQADGEGFYDSRGLILEVR